MQSRPVIIGMNNPHSADLADALSCYGRKGTGWRLWKMLNEVTGASEDQYMQAFDRRNLIAGPWKVQKALDGADDMKLPEGAEVLVLGEEVRSAFGLPKVLIHPVHRDGATWRQVPHPSGRCFFYNDKTQRYLVSMVLKDLYDRSQSSGL